MSEYREDNRDQIDLIMLIMTIWEGKFKIISISFVFLFCMIGYNYVSPQITITATTEIKPINSIQSDYYNSLNDIGFFDINPEIILDLYIENLEDKTLFEKSIKKYDLLNRADYNTEQSYDKAVSDLAFTIEIEQIEDTHLELSFQYNDIDKWKLALQYIDELANESVRLSLIELFNNAITQAKQRRDFEIEDILLKIENAKENYHRSTLNKLAFLIEQKEIAIASNIPSSTFEELTIGLNTPSTEGVLYTPPELDELSSDETFVPYVMKDIPYYFRGYEPISKEIELIQSRENIEPFVPQLITLESQIRKYKQDKQFERAENIFELSPIQNPKDFVAVLFLYEGTIFEYESRFRLLLILAALIGGGIGIVYVVLSDAISKRKKQLISN
tara:strand:- start:7700 stop:8866 length:1167 start_codon:yes stop_codon:yes gene_type:complete